MQHEQDSFSKADLMDLAADPLELLKILGSDQAKSARNRAETEAVTQLGTQHQTAYTAPLQLNIPTDWADKDRRSFAVIHHSAEALEVTAVGPKPKRMSATNFGAPSALPGTVVHNTTIQNELTPYGQGRGCCSNVYLGVPLVSKSTGQQYAVNITVGVSFIDPDLFEGFDEIPLMREAIAKGMIEILPPTVQFQAKMISKLAREKCALAALRQCSDVSDLQWHADLLPGSEIARNIQKKIKFITEES